nr:twin-arginine translocase TatA/TatE family subunit [Campylobacter sp.]
MFGMSLPEIIVILVIAVLVLGPDKLPEALVKFAKFFKYFKAQVSSAKSNFEQEVRIAELKADAAKLKSSVTDISSNVRKKLTFEELDELKKSASDFSTELKSSLDFSQTNTSSEGSIENSRIPNENSRISSENSKVENSRIPSENSQNQVLDKLNVVDKLNSDPLNTKIYEQREGKNV